MRIIWTNGCFDIMHPGHMELFKAAKALGDRLIVGVDTDEKVALDKGADRPINNLAYRVAMLEAIKYIDEVHVFGSRTELEELIEFYNGKIAKWWTPDDVVFVEELPHTPTGKVLKTKLREEYSDYVLPSA
mgnify:CR=1 FL=1